MQKQRYVGNYPKRKGARYLLKTHENEKKIMKTLTCVGF